SGVLASRRSGYPPRRSASSPGRAGLEPDGGLPRAGAHDGRCRSRAVEQAPVKVLLTGADGFVGGWLARRMLACGHSVVGTHRSGTGPSPVLSSAEAARVEWRELELGNAESIEQAMRGRWDAVVHLAALSSGSEARENPGLAWEVNAA